MNPALRHVFLASLWHRRLATFLSLLAIALGVALGLAVQLIHSAALEEFDRGIRLLNGSADLQVLGSRAGFNDALYPNLALSPAVDQASPLLEIEARLPGRDETLKIIGIDFFRIGLLTPALLPIADDSVATRGTEKAADGERLDALSPDALFLSPAAAEHLGLLPEDMLRVQVGTAERNLRIAGSVPGAGVGQRLAVMDIAAAQQTFERIGLITRVDLRLAPGVTRAMAKAQLGGRLPPGVAMLTPEDESSEALRLSRAYRVNLTMLAAIALLTGGFLVFSTQWLAVVRRRQEFAFLCAIGLDRTGLRRGLLAEGAVLGLGGAIAGCLLAYLLTAIAFALIGGDLGAGFFRGLAPQVHFEPLLTLVYLVLGVLAGLAGAWLPARETARMIPARALRAGDEAEVYRARPRWGMALAVLTLAALCCLAPPIGGVPVLGYLAVALILFGAILVLPGVTAWSMPHLPAGRSTLWRLARARLTAAPAQVVVAGAGVVASVALAVSMAIMVDSFRGSVDNWLTQLLPADLYLRASDAGASGYLEPQTVDRIAALPGIAELQPARFESLRLTTTGPEMGYAIELIARPVRDSSGLPLVAGTLRPAEELDSVWISEAAADRLSLGVGDSLALPLGNRSHDFRVSGIWRDYARQQGSVVVEIADYRALTGDNRANNLGLVLTADTTPEAVMTAIRAMLGEQKIELILPGKLRSMILDIFDRTFLVTYLMEAVAILIGLFGIGTTFAALATSRRKELGILRHLGLRRRQVGTLLASEAALSTLVGVIIGLLAGGAIALVLIEVVNRQSFRWSMDLQLPIGLLLVFSLSMILLAALAARLSGAQAMRQDAVLAVREDW
ncbi:MAG: FtsX-like permease family protein [Thiohalocapsa sp. PB-PSB1]|jgi:putative ABC transport system permease protein|nr:MAG: FtsX-like permease family protein [Thiohalocapsa sp. PB-PSB1]HCS91679.1 ABC transporter permease [Chromatiaceae bacterium]